jgi:hypothetical protein
VLNEAFEGLVGVPFTDYVCLLELINDEEREARKLEAERELFLEWLRRELGRLRKTEA